MSKLSDCFYRVLLRLYPSDYRREYGELMVRNFHDIRRDFAMQRRWWRWVVFWLHIFGDTAVSVFVEHREVNRERAMSHNGMSMSGWQRFMFVLPVIVLIVYLQSFRQEVGPGAIYAVLWVTGLVLWGLSRLGVIAYSPLWQAYTIGTTLGFASIAMILWVGGFNWINQLPWLVVPESGGLIGWANSFPAIFVIGFTIGLYIIGLFFLSYLLKPSSKVFYIAAVVIPLLCIITLSSEPIMSAMTYLLTVMGEIWVQTSERMTAISVMVILAQALISLGVCAICLDWTRRRGGLGVIALIIALGTPYIFLEDLNDDRIGWVVMLFPLVICPLWWLTAPTSQMRRWGTFILWSGFAIFLALKPLITLVIFEAQVQANGVDLALFNSYRDGSVLAFLLRLTPGLLNPVALWVVLRAAQAHPDLSLAEPLTPIMEPDAMR